MRRRSLGPRSRSAELARALRSVYHQPEDAAARGEAAYARISKDWTWAASVAAMRHRLAEVVCPEPPAPRAPAIPWRPGKK